MDSDEKVQSLTEEEAKKMLEEVVTRQPSLLHDLLDGHDGAPGGYHPPSPPDNAPSWCVCGHCRQMPKPEERKCCGRQPNLCVSLMPDFRVLILDPGVLAIARTYRQEIFVLDEDGEYNKCNRHTAYRQFILWQHGRLGTGDRRVIPSCCVWGIRDKYSDQYNQYTGFVPSRLA